MDATSTVTLPPAQRGHVHDLGPGPAAGLHGACRRASGQAIDSALTNSKTCRPSTASSGLSRRAARRAGGETRHDEAPGVHHRRLRRPRRCGLGSGRRLCRCSYGVICVRPSAARGRGARRSCAGSLLPASTGLSAHVREIGHPAVAAPGLRLVQRASAASSRSTSSSVAPVVATPTLAVTASVRPPRRNGSVKALHMRAASLCAAASSATPATTTNSSPPRRRRCRPSGRAARSRLAVSMRYEVAGAVAVRVVHPLEVVDVDEERGEDLSVTERPRRGPAPCAPRAASGSAGPSARRASPGGRAAPRRAPARSRRGCW